MKLSSVQFNQLKDFFSRRSEVAAVYLHGSQADGLANSLSDVDLGVLIKNQVAEKEHLKLQLEYIRAVEKVTKQDLTADVKLLNDKQSLMFLTEVINNGKLVTVNDFPQLENFVHRVSMAYPDFYPYLKQYYAAMRQRLMEGTYAAGY